MLVLGLFTLPVFSEDSSIGSVVTGDTSEVIKRENELSVNGFGILYGSYTVKYERSFSDGLFGVGPRLTYQDSEIFGIKFKGFSGFIDFRVYPGRYRRGFYLYGSGGYSHYLVSGFSESAYISNTSAVVGLGWKWVMNEFAIDLGFGTGKAFYSSSDQVATDAINENIPYTLDGYLQFAYRF